MPVVLITGATRGIGRALVKAYLKYESTTVLAGVHQIDSDISKSLLDISAGEASKVVLVKIDATAETDAAETIQILKWQGVSCIDVVIASAGVLNMATYVNLLGPLRLWQAVASLVREASVPKFIVISSIAGTMGMMEQVRFPSSAYGISKAAANFLVRALHFENEHLTTLAIDPGDGLAEAVDGSAHQLSTDNSSVSIPARVEEIMALIYRTTKLNGSGQFVRYDGSVIPL